MVTVFTPVYNRAYIIAQLYQSLLKQTSFDFEWIIIDDGSTDRIAELVQQWKNVDNPFPIHFFQQENGGKHRAINRGVQLARGDAFFIVDSDDYLTENAIWLIREWWKDIASDNCYAGVSGLRARVDGQVIGDIRSFDGYVDATNLERETYGLGGDKAEVYKTEVLRKYPFPEFEGENFITEDVVWDRIANDGYKIRWHNQVIYMCEYREDGLTWNGADISRRNPRGWGLYIRQSRQFGRTDRDKDYMAKLGYYEVLHTKLSDIEFMEYLGIDECELEDIRKYIPNTLRYIGSNIAVYGLGKRGQRLLKLYHKTPVTIKYVLDQKLKTTEYAQYELDEELPEVDAIIITPKEGQEEIMDMLRRRTNSRLIGYDRWKDCVQFGALCSFL